MLKIKLPNGYGSIVKLTGKRRRPYMVRKTIGFDDDGKQKMAIIGYYRTKKEALSALADYNKFPIPSEAIGMTFKELYELWYKLKEPTIESMKGYEASYRYCKPIENNVFADLRVADFQAVIDSCNFGRASKKQIKSLINQLTKYAMANDIVHKNYIQFCTIPSEVQSTLHKVFVKEEIEILWEYEKDDKIKLILILIYTGMRIGELLKVKKEDVYIKEHYLIGGSKTEAGKNRVIPIADKIYPFVKTLYFDNETKYLVAHPKKRQKPLTYSQFMIQVWNKFIEEYGFMDHLPHDTRHTCATLMSNADVNMKIRKLILGHASKDVTERVYDHKTIEDLKQAINTI